MNVGTWDHKTLVLQLARLLYNVHSGASLQGTSWEWALCPLYSGASLQGTSWFFVAYTVEPRQVGDGWRACGWGRGAGTQWSLSTRDKLGTGPLSLIQWSLALYKGQVGDGSFVPLSCGTSLQGTSWGRVLCPLIQWNLSTRDKLGTGPLSPYPVEPLYKGQVGDSPLSLIQWNLSTRDKLGEGPLSLIQ